MSFSLYSSQVVFLINVLILFASFSFLFISLFYVLSDVFFLSFFFFYFAVNIFENALVQTSYFIICTWKSSRWQRNRKIRYFSSISIWFEFISIVNYREVEKIIFLHLAFLYSSLWFILTLKAMLQHGCDCATMFHPVKCSHVYIYAAIILWAKY